MENTIKVLIDMDKYAKATQSIAILIEDVAEKYEMGVEEVINDLSILLNPSIEAHREYKEDVCNG